MTMVIKQTRVAGKKYYRAVFGDLVVEAEEHEKAWKKIQAEIKAGNAPLLSIEHDSSITEEEFDKDWKPILQAQE